MQCRNIVPEIPEQYEEMKPLVFRTKTKCNAIHDDVNVQQYNSCRTEIYCEDQGEGRAKGRPVDSDQEGHSNVIYRS